MLPKCVAEKIIAELVTTMKDWKNLATRLGICKRERDLFAGIFEKRIRF